MNMSRSVRWPKIPPNSMAARVLLAFLGTAGVLYVNIMPALVDGLRQGLGFSNKQAGLVGSFNVYGYACGGLFIAFVVRRIPWRSTARFLLVGLVCVDLLSMLFHSPSALMGIRFVDGAIGGILSGVAMSIMARTTAPDRSFGALVLVQALAAGVGIMSLPRLVPKFGVEVVFGALILFSLTTLFMLPFLPDYAVPATEESAHGARPENLNRKLFLLALFSVLFLEIAYMGLFSFMIGLGTHHGLGLAFTSTTLGICSWCATLGALLVIVLSTRYGTFKPIVAGMLVGLISIYALNYSEVKWIWMAANVGLDVTWLFGISHLLGICSRFDETGQAAVWGGFAAATGLASGPLLGSFIVGAGNYTELIALGVVFLGCALFFVAAPAWALDHREAAGVPAREGEQSAR
jgi:predicted MFS family arabinose efflux permease